MAPSPPSRASAYQWRNSKGEVVAFAGLSEAFAQIDIAAREKKDADGNNARTALCQMRLDYQSHLRNCRMKMKESVAECDRNAYRTARDWSAKWHTALAELQAQANTDALTLLMFRLQDFHNPPPHQFDAGMPALARFAPEDAEHAVLHHRAKAYAGRAPHKAGRLSALRAETAHEITRLGGVMPPPIVISPWERTYYI